MDTEKDLQKRCVSLLEKGLSRNHVESIAYNSGLDFDHIRGKDDEFSNKENNKE